jgi:HPr kinase/phosphorylase
VHATCVAIGEAGVLLRGPSGSGKSDLALRLIDAGARLVADDRVTLERVPGAGSGALRARAPNAIKGKMEVRGIGICTPPAREFATLALAVDLVASDGVERLPESATCAYLGVTLPLVAIAPFEASAAAKVRLAVAALNGNSCAQP